MGILGVLVQDPLTVFVGAGPIPVFQEHEGPFQQRRCAGAGRLLDDDLLPGLVLGFGLRPVQHLVDAADQVLDKADLGHIVGLEHGQGFGEIVGVHVPITGQQ